MYYSCTSDYVLPYCDQLTIATLEGQQNGMLHMCDDTLEGIKRRFQPLETRRGDWKGGIRLNFGFANYAALQE